MPNKWLTKSKTTSLSKLDPKITDYLGTLPPHLQSKFLITATSDGRHSTHSLHYSNKAVDMRYDDELWNYISKDPKRHEYGLTLINPDHGSAKHIHLSNAKGTKKEWWGEVDAEGRKKVYDTKGWDLNEITRSGNVPNTNANNVNNFLTQYEPISVSPIYKNIEPVESYQEQRYIPLEQSQVTDSGMDNWNPFGWESGQILLKPLNQEKPKSKKRISEQEKAQLNSLLGNVNPILRGAIQQIIGGIEEEDNVPQSVFGEDEPTTSQYQSILSDDESSPSGWLNRTSSSRRSGNSGGRSGQYNAGNLRNSDGSFMSFGSPEEGRQALVNQLRKYQTNNTKTRARSDMSLYETMEVYAPASNNNNPKRYAEFIAERLNISPNTQIKDIDTDAWADAISVMEGNKSYLNSKKEYGGELSEEKAKKMLDEGIVNGKPITEKQRKYVSSKQNGGILTNNWLNEYEK